MTGPPPDTPTPAEQATTVIVSSMEDHVVEVRPAGSSLEDDYRIVEVRGGRGVSGMGIVYIVEGAGRKYAVKTFQRRFSRDLLFIQRFVREARTWMLIGFHPNVVRAYQLDIIQAVPYLFMEYVASDAAGRHSLAALLQEGPLPLHQALHYALQCCHGMAHATAAVPGLVHRDLKPENLLLTPEGVLKISDFGLVRCRDEQDNPLHAPQRTVLLGDGHLTEVGSIFGTPSYMAPEQFSEASTVTTAADIYAWGCTFYEAMSGAPPFVVSAGSTLERIAHLKRKHLEAEPAALSAVVPECPATLNDIVMRCLEKDPAQRWGSFGEIAARLEKVIQDLDCWHPLPQQQDPSAREVAEQSRSLTLLDGYDRAIRLRNLRESQDSRPYAFHLALASYFLCHNDPIEERRQLEKAARARSEESGYEVARRLGELLLHSGKAEAAELLLEDFLAEYPEELERVLEPYCRMLCARGRCAEAAALLEGFPPTLRVQMLRADLLRQRGQHAELARLLREVLEEQLQEVADRLGRITPDLRVGWSAPGDRERLETVIALLRPGLSWGALDAAEHARWPDLMVDLDFAPPLAWISEVAGQLSELLTEVTPLERNHLRQVAEVLDYPDRLVRHLQREECWFWMRETPEEGT